MKNMAMLNKSMVPALQEENRLPCAREMEEFSRGEGQHIYKHIMIPCIRKKYSGIPIIIENHDGINYLVTEVSVVECEYQPNNEDKIPHFTSNEKIVKWYFPIFEDKSDNNYKKIVNIHVFGRGYTDGTYHQTPKYGSSNLGSLQQKLMPALNNTIDDANCYRLLDHNDTIRSDDEFLEDDAKTWTPIWIEHQWNVGSYWHTALKPMRRIINGD
jgi:hypothetical protein